MINWMNLMNTPGDRGILARHFKNFLIKSSIVLFLSWILSGLILHSRILLRLLLGEDRIVENLSALAYLAAIIIAVCWIRRLSHSGISRWYWALPVLAFFCLLEEISFGYNFIKYFKRVSIYGVNIDAVHDFLGVASNVIKDKVAVYVVLFFTAFMVLIIGLLFFRCRRSIREMALNHPAFGYVIFGIACGMAASVIDLPFMESKRGKFGFLVFLEETLEFFMAVSILFAAYALPLFHRKNVKQPAP